MDDNFNKFVCKSGFYLCWLMIISIGIIYAASTTEPRENRIFHMVKVPNVDPLIHVDTHFYALPQQMYNYQYKHVPPNESLINKSKNFYSEIGSSAYYSTFYRPDFEQYPTQTGLILFFRVATFAGLILFLFLLAKMFQSGYASNPFVNKNVQRLFFMGFIMMLLAILRTAHSIALAGFIRLDPKLLGYDVTPSYTSLWIILPGLLLISGSFFYEKLIHLHEEQKLTV
jgi:hypothetical protein